jgi:hypothetical protein
MSRGRWVVLAAIFSATTALAIWLYTYRVTTTFFFIDPTGRPFHPPYPADVQPWWSTPATVAIAVVGAFVIAAVRFGPRQLSRRLARSARQFAKPSH